MAGTDIVGGKPSQAGTFFKKNILPVMIGVAAMVEGHLASIGRTTAARPATACVTALLAGHLVGRAVWRDSIKRS